MQDAHFHAESIRNFLIHFVHHIINKGYVYKYDIGKTCMYSVGDTYFRTCHLLVYSSIF